MLEAGKTVELHQALKVNDWICFSLGLDLWSWSTIKDEYKYER